MKKYVLITLLANLFAGLFLSETHAQLSLDLEGSYIFGVPYNSVRIPASGGSNFDLSEDLDRKETFAYRIRGSVTLGKRHVISLLYAPLSVKYTGTIPRPILYNGYTFPANDLLNATYKFNSYRLTYRYKIVNSEKWVVALGVSAKIRDAGITLSNDSVSTTYPNVGFVPLINFYVSWRFIEKVRLVVEGDALASKQGRAEDVFAGLYYNVSEKIALKGGYRILEGGANVDSIYNFTLVNYASLGVVIDF